MLGSPLTCNTQSTFPLPRLCPPSSPERHWGGPPAGPPRQPGSSRPPRGSRRPPGFHGFTPKGKWFTIQGYDPQRSRPTERSRVLIPATFLPSHLARSSSHPRSYLTPPLYGHYPGSSEWPPGPDPVQFPSRAGKQRQGRCLHLDPLQQRE